MGNEQSAPDGGNKSHRYLKVQSVARTENEKILATNASSEATLERQKMIILFMKIMLLSLQSRAICNWVFMLTRALK